MFILCLLNYAFYKLRIGRKTLADKKCPNLPTLFFFPPNLKADGQKYGHFTKENFLNSRTKVMRKHS